VRRQMGGGIVPPAGGGHGPNGLRHRRRHRLRLLQCGGRAVEIDHTYLLGLCEKETSGRAIETAGASFLPYCISQKEAGTFPASLFARRGALPPRYDSMTSLYAPLPAE